MITRLLAASAESTAERTAIRPDVNVQDFVQLLLRQLNPKGLPLPAPVATRSLRRGQHLYWPGDTPGFVYSVSRGALKTYRVLHDCTERISGFHFRGELLGLDALSDRPVRCGAVALDSVMVYLIPVQTLFECLGRSGPMRSQLLERYGNEIARLEEHLSLEGLSAEQRLAAFVLWILDRLSAASAQPTVSLPMSHKEIGNYLGMVPETMSRLLSRFQDRRCLSISRRDLTVWNLPELRQIAGGSGPGEPPAASRIQRG